jgi:hypothetical protein
VARAGRVGRRVALIVAVKFDRTVSHHTVAQTLAHYPLPKVVGRRFPRYFKMRDREERHEAIPRLHLDGWSTKAIVGYLGAPRRSVQAFLTRWVVHGVQSLPGKKPSRPRGVRTVTLPVIATIKAMQETSAVGEFRMAAYLRQHHHIELSPRTCGRIMAANRELYGLAPGKVQAPTRVPKAMPFAATYAHQVWSVGAIRFPETVSRRGMGSTPQGVTTRGAMSGAIPDPLGEGGNASSPR